MSGYIRLVAAGDAAEIQSIYAPYIENTAITFEDVVPTVADFAKRIADISSFYPYLAYVENGVINGYAYAARQNDRGAYRYNATVSVYLRPEAQGKRLGGRLYSRLFRLLHAQGMRTAYAGITLPNEKSLRLHAALGFTPVGTYERTGYKFGKWLDVTWLEKRLGDFASVPEPPRAIGDLPDDVIAKILETEE